MAINRLAALALLLATTAVSARESASSPGCQAAGSTPVIVKAQAAAERDPMDLPARFNLADAWSDAGCFNEAVQVLQKAQQLHPDNAELDTRLRVAKSLVGEQSYFENLDRADAEAKLKRDSFRCTSLADLDACNEAVRMKPDDAALLTASADALIQAKRPAEAVGRYRRALSLAPNRADLTAKLSAAEAQERGASPPAAVAAGSATSGPKKAIQVRVARATPAESRQASNVEPLTRSH